MKIVILALEGLFDTGLFVTLDTFSLANNFLASQMGGTPRFDVTVLGGGNGSGLLRANRYRWKR